MWVRERTHLIKKEFANKSLFPVVELKESIPRLFHSPDLERCELTTVSLYLPLQKVSQTF